MKVTENYTNIIKTVLFVQYALIFMVFMSLIASLMTLFGLIDQFDFRLIAILILFIYVYLQNMERNLWQWLVEKYAEQQNQQVKEYDELFNLCDQINNKSKLQPNDR